MDLKEWTDAAIDVYQDLQDAGLSQSAAAEVTTQVLREFGRDMRNRDVNAAAESSWRGKPVSEKQERLLIEYGFTVTEVEEMTRGEASDELDRILGGD